jgi:hypothetical protein
MWFRILIVLIAGSLISLRLFTAPNCIYMNGMKMKYVQFLEKTWESYLHEQAKEWRESILWEKTFNEQPLEIRVGVANNFFLREIATKEKVASQPQKIKEALRKYIEDAAKVMDIYTFLLLFPEYDDLSDNEIKIKMFNRYYKKDMSIQDFNDSFLHKAADNPIIQSVKIPGPHYKILPSMDLAILLSHTFSLYLILLIVERRGVKNSPKP